MVCVTWLDAFDGPQGWVYQDTHIPNPVSPTTIGYFLEGYLDGHVSVCSSHYRDDSDRLVISNLSHIPEGMVVSIAPIRP